MLDLLACSHASYHGPLQSHFQQVVNRVCLLIRSRLLQPPLTAADYAPANGTAIASLIALPVSAEQGPIADVSAALSPAPLLPAEGPIVFTVPGPAPADTPALSPVIAGDIGLAVKPHVLRV